MLGEHKGNSPGVVGLSNSGVGVHGKAGRLAGYFEGDVAWQAISVVRRNKFEFGKNDVLQAPERAILFLTK